MSTSEENVIKGQDPATIQDVTQEKVLTTTTTTTTKIAGISSTKDELSEKSQQTTAIPNENEIALKSIQREDDDVENRLVKCNVPIDPDVVASANMLPTFENASSLTSVTTTPIDDISTLMTSDESKVIDANATTATTSMALNPTSTASTFDTVELPIVQKSSIGSDLISFAQDEEQILCTEKDEKLAKQLTENVQEEACTVLTSNTTTTTAAATTATATSTTAASSLTSPQNTLATMTTSNVSHMITEPTFCKHLQSDHQHQQQQLFKNYHDSKFESSITTSRSSSSSPTHKGESLSASGSPNMLHKSTESPATLPRRVSFPKSDSELVTGYLEPANPWEHVNTVKTISEVAELYVTSCRKHNTTPLQTVLDHLKVVELSKQVRHPLLCLKSIKLTPSDCEALEEIFKRIQYKSIDLSSCELDECALSALFEMIEYYEATNELDISSNAKGMTPRLWSYCSAMVGHTQGLQSLTAHGNPISDSGADHLGQSLATSNLHTLKLEHCGLRGRALTKLCVKLQRNRILKELWLAYNDLDVNDAGDIANLLKVNLHIEFIDISNNNITDKGVRQIVEALLIQWEELERKSIFKRSAAIDDDDSFSSTEILQTIDLSESESSEFESKTGSASMISSTGEQSNCKVAQLSEDSTSDGSLNLLKKVNHIDDKSIDSEKVHQLKIQSTAMGTATAMMAAATATAVAPATATATTTLIPMATIMSVNNENDADDDTEDTVKTTNVKTTTTTTHPSGQSMLDKLLSMSSDSSSDDGASNLSTDTIAACYSEDTSIISDDIFDVASTVATNATTTTTNANAKAVSGNIPAPALINVFPSSATIIKDDQPQQMQLEQKQKDNENVVIDIITLSEAKESVHRDICTDSTNSNSKTVTDSTQTINSLNNNNHNNNNNNNNNSNSNVNCKNTTNGHNIIADNESKCLRQHVSDLASPLAASALRDPVVFEVTAEESDCVVPEGSGGVGGVGGAGATNVCALEEHGLLLHQSTKAVDVNKNTKLGEDYDDTHSTDSAFESASEGDISRHLPEEFSRLSSSFESSRLDDSTRDLAIETATIATESTECLLDAGVTPSSTPTPPTPPIERICTPAANVNSTIEPPSIANAIRITTNEQHLEGGVSAAIAATAVTAATTATATVTTTATTSTTTANVQSNHYTIDTNKESKDNKELCDNLPSLPRVTIAEQNLILKHKESENNPAPTPPPPSSSPGGASHGMRRTESTSTFLTQASRNRSQSSDSLCSDNSLDGSISSELNYPSSSQLNEKLTKNDTLTRQQKQLDGSAEPTARVPGGLKALALWNNNLTKESGFYISDLLKKTQSLELLNIGKNCLSNDFVTRIKESLIQNSTLTTLGLQSAHLSADGIGTLVSILTFGGNSTLQRIDIRDNKLEVESLTKLAEALKSNTTVTQIDIDDEPKRISVGSDEHVDYTRILENVRSMCSRNEKTQAQLQAEKAANAGPANKRRCGYYMGSRKISLTCHSRPLIDTSVGTKSGPNKLEPKRKTGTRLRSPVPSPPSMSPSSSPNRSRFQVFRVHEVSPLTSPLAQTPPTATTSPTPPPPAAIISSVQRQQSSSSVSIPTICTSEHIKQSIIASSMPTSSSLPSMATITSSTQSIKRMSISPRSRFHVSKIYEDPRVPITKRALPPITPPITLPPTPMMKSAPKCDLKPEVENTSTTEGHNAANNSDNSHNSSNSSNTAAAIVTTTNDNDATITNNMCIDHLSHMKSKTQCSQDSTKSITNTTTTKTATITKTTTIQTLSPLDQSSSSSSSPSSSSSSSTSPASITSNSSTASASSSSSTSTGSPLSTVFASSSSSADETDSSSVGASKFDMLPPITARCPIAIFNDNDITLTKNSESVALSNAVAAATHSTTQDSGGGCCGGGGGAVIDSANAESLQQQRTRKMSWIGNQGPVDKLRSLFQNPVTIFQRSSSPEQKVPAPITTFQINNAIGNTTNNIRQQQSEQQLQQQQQQQQLQQPQQQQTSLVPTRKNSHTSWTKLGTEILGGSPSSDTGLVVTSAAAATIEQSKSLIDAASRQIRDFSKHVFRQNLSFGNEPNNTVSLSSSAGSLAIEGGNAVDIGGNGLPAAEHDATHIPTEVKQEIKENISPEHTINEETLHSLQKLNANVNVNVSGVVAKDDTLMEMISEGLKTFEELKDDNTATATTALPPATAITTTANSSTTLTTAVTAEAAISDDGGSSVSSNASSAI